MDRTTTGRNGAFALAALALVAAAAAHAGSPVSDEKIAVAKASLARAEQSGAPQAAPVELAKARDKITLAEKANSDHDSKPAIKWAEQADVDARVAEATADQQRAHKAAAEFDLNMQALRQESVRATPTNP